MFSFSLKPWVLGVLCTLFFFKPVHAQSPFNSASYDLLSAVTPTGRLADRSELGNWISHSNANPLYHRGMGDSLWRRQKNPPGASRGDLCLRASLRSSEAIVLLRLL